MKFKIKYHCNTFENGLNLRIIIAYTSYDLRGETRRNNVFTKTVGDYQLQHIKRK